MNWINQKLNRKFLTSTAIGLISMSLLFLVLFITSYRTQIEAERNRLSSHMNQLLQLSLENAMLKRDLDGLRNIVYGLGMQSDIGEVMILNPAGEVRFASKQNSLGQHYPRIGATIQGTTFFTTNESGQDVLRSINPVRNKPRCLECHGPVSQNPINGILVVDYDAGILKMKTRNTTIALMGAGSLVVLVTLIGGWWFIRRFVLKPINRLRKAQMRFSRGDYDSRVSLVGTDEMADLSHSFNTMAQTIRDNVSRLKENQCFLQSLIDCIPDGIRLIDQQYRIVLANNAYLEQADLDRESVCNAFCHQISHNRSTPCIPTMTTCPIHLINQGEQTVKAVHRHVDSKGLENNVEISAAPIKSLQGDDETLLVVEVIRDMKNTIQFSQEQRLSSIGELAAGVAHEIHNPLGSIRIAFQAIDKLIAAGKMDPQEIKSYLELVEGEINDCIDITGKLLKLSTWPSSGKQLVEVNQAIDDTVTLLSWEAKKNQIKVETTFPERSPRILANDGETRMVALNLIQNAYHAMPDGGKIKIDVAISNDRVMIQFADTGIGIEKKALHHIFDPFYSHRADKLQGTGLGLPISKAIVEKFGGEILVSSKPGQGTTFTVSLPDADA